MSLTSLLTTKTFSDILPNKYIHSSFLTIFWPLFTTNCGSIQSQHVETVKQLYHYNKITSLNEVLSTFYRVVNDMGLISSNVAKIKFHNTKIIWQLKAAQDLLWNLILTTLLDVSPMSFTSHLQVAPQREVLHVANRCCHIQLDHRP